MKPITLPVQVQVKAVDLVRSVEAADLGFIFSQLANHFAATPSLIRVDPRSAKNDGRRRAVAEIHAQLNEEAKVMLAEVLALEFSAISASTPKNAVGETGAETSAATEGQAA